MKGTVLRIVPIAAAIVLSLGLVATPLGAGSVRADGGTISGNVVGSAGNLGGISVSACTTNMSSCSTATQTDAAGNFSLGGLAPGAYLVAFHPSVVYQWGYYVGPGLNPDYIYATAVNSNATLIDVQLALGFSISGTITGLAGGLTNIRVSAFNTNPMGPGASFAAVDTSGRYVFAGLAPGTYVLHFEDQTYVYAVGFYGGSGLTPVQASEAQISVTDHDVTIPTFEMPLGVSITGTVTGSAGHLGGIYVDVSSAVHDFGMELATNGSGQFAFRGLFPDDYRIRFEDVSGTYVGGYYSPGGLVQDENVAPITVGAEGLDLTVALQMGASIDGTITDMPENWQVSLSACPIAGGLCRPGVSDMSGHFTVKGLASETYTLAFTDPSGRFASGYYSDSGAAVPDKAQATPITVPPSVSGLTIVLDMIVPGAPTNVTAISGDGSATVSWAAPKDDGGSPIQSYSVRSSPYAGYCYAATPSCTVSGLTNGTTYTFTVQAYNGLGNGPISAPSNAITPGPAQQAQSITFDSLPNAGYGAAPITLAATASSGLPVSYSSAGPCSVTNAMLALTGAGTCTVTASQDGNANWAAAATSQTLTIAPAPLTVTAPGAIRAYGAANPAFSPTYGGLVNGDTAASLSTLPSCSTSATAASPVGKYPITCSGAASANYTFTYVAGTLTIAIADRFVTPTSKTLTVAAPGLLALSNTPGATVVISTKPAGKLTLGSGGSFVYVPKSGFSGTDTFSYRLNVGGKLSAPVTVSIYVVGTGTNCARCNLSGLSVSGVNLKGANLSYANLAGTRLDHANLTGANLSKAMLTNADLTDANLTGANLAGATLRGATIKGVTWSSTICPDGSNSSKDHGTCVGHLNP